MYLVFGNYLLNIISIGSTPKIEITLYIALSPFGWRFFGFLSCFSGIGEGLGDLSRVVLPFLPPRPDVSSGGNKEFLDSGPSLE